MRRVSGVLGFPADAPALIAQADASELQEASVLISLAIDSANGRILDRAAGLGSEVVWPRDEFRDVYQCPEVVVCNGNCVFISGLDVVRVRRDED